MVGVRMVRMLRIVGVVAAALAVQSSGLSGQSGQGQGEWRAYGADKGSSRYSPLTLINRDNARSLRVVWRQSVLPQEMRGQLSADFDARRWPNVSQNTPLMIGGLLYVSTPLGTAAALDPESGKVVWFDTPPAREAGTALRAPSRGVAYWTDGTAESSRSPDSTLSPSTPKPANATRTSAPKAPAMSICRRATIVPHPATGGADRHSSFAT
jgi:glucose dehydrogenase